MDRTRWNAGFFFRFKQLAEEYHPGIPPPRQARRMLLMARKRHIEQLPHALIVADDAGHWNKPPPHGC